MKRTRLFGLSLLFATTLFTGCDKKESDPPAITVENEQVLTQTAYADETKGESGVTFVTAGAWTSTITEGMTKAAKAGTTAWVTIDPDHGDKAGTYTITISLEPNATGEERTAVITITCNGVDISITVTQKGTKEDGGIPVSGVTLNKNTLTLEEGDKETLTATVQPEDAADKNVSWKSSNTDVATVADGVVTAVAPGTATITVTTADSDKTATCTVTVNEDIIGPNRMILVTQAYNQVMFRLGGSGTATINWGDGTKSEVHTLYDYPDDPSYHYHVYADVSEHIIKIEGEDVTYLRIDTRFTSIDVSKNTGLKSLWCESAPLKSLDVSKNTELEFLECYNTQLTSLDVSKNIALTHLSCGTNQLTALDISKNTALRTLNCSYNQLTSLDVSKNTALYQLGCSFNPLTSLDVSKNTALWDLSCADNQLTSLDVSKNTALRMLLCSRNQLTSLDVSKNFELNYLDCRINQLTSLDMSKNITLAYLECHDNQLTSLDVSKNTALTSLVCQSNKLSTATLNSLFGTLHGNVFDYAAKVIYVGNNPGTETCDRNIAKNKGWTVNDLRSY